MTHFRSRSTLARLAAAALATAMLAACSGDDGGEVESAVGSSIGTVPGETVPATDAAGNPLPPAPVDPNAPAGASTTVAAGGAGAASTTAPAGGPATTTAASSSVPKPIIPAAGTYTYQTTVEDADGPSTEQTTQRVERLSGDDRTGRVRLTSTNSEGSQTTEATVGDTSVIVERTKISSPLGEIDCDWQPDWMFLGEYRAGSTWTFSSTCDDTIGTTKVHVVLSGSGSIPGTEQTTTADGQALTAWVEERTIVIDIDVTLSPTQKFKQKVTTVDRSLVDPARGIAVRSTSTATSEGAQPGTSKRTSVLSGYSAG